jgi:hypothetical protein
MSTRTRARRFLPNLGTLAVVGVLVAACGSGMSGMNHTGPAAPTSMAGHDGMPGMEAMASGDGLAEESDGFRFVPATTSLPAGQPTSLAFRVTGTSGKAVTAFEPDQTKPMHFYLIRSDLTGFQHVHPTMAGDGTWTAPLAAAAPGTYRAYASFISRDATGKAVPLVLSQRIAVPGTAAPTPLPPASATTEVDGYTVTLAGDRPMAGMSHDLTVTVSQNGKPVTDLQPYLDTYAHLTAFHDGDLAFAHLHPHDTVNGDHGGPALTFEAMLPKPGQWRLFLQFQTGGALHTAAVTVTIG